jgi:hypothetical protein
MGLDMYLNARKYVSQVKYVDGDKIPVEDFSTLVDMSGLEGLTKYSLFGGVEISYPVAQWRKANAIHGWFVNNLAGGVDECQPIEASRDHLKLLLTACKEVLAETDEDEKAAKADDVGLSPTSGFFFGTYELDEYYDADLKYTIEMLEHVMSLIGEDDYDWGFTYQASW